MQCQYQIVQSLTAKLIDQDIVRVEFLVRLDSQDIIHWIVFVHKF